MQVRHSERGRLPNNILQSALSTLHSPNPHVTAVFCTVPRNRIFLYRRQVYIFPTPTRNKGLGKPNQKSEIKNQKNSPQSTFSPDRPLVPRPSSRTHLTGTTARHPGTYKDSHSDQTSGMGTCAPHRNHTETKHPPGSRRVRRRVSRGCHSHRPAKQTTRPAAIHT